MQSNWVCTFLHAHICGVCVCVRDIFVRRVQFRLWWKNSLKIPRDFCFIDFCRTSGTFDNVCKIVGCWYRICKLHYQKLGWFLFDLVLLIWIHISGEHSDEFNGITDFDQHIAQESCWNQENNKWTCVETKYSLWCYLIFTANDNKFLAIFSSELLDSDRKKIMNLITAYTHTRNHRTEREKKLWNLSVSTKTGIRYYCIAYRMGVFFFLSKATSDSNVNADVLCRRLINIFQNSLELGINWSGTYSEIHYKTIWYDNPISMESNEIYFQLI